MNIGRKHFKTQCNTKLNSLLTGFKLQNAQVQNANKFFLISSLIESFAVVLMVYICLPGDAAKLYDHT